MPSVSMRLVLQFKLSRKRISTGSFFTKGINGTSQSYSFKHPGASLLRPALAGAIL